MNNYIDGKNPLWLETGVCQILGNPDVTVPKDVSSWMESFVAGAELTPDEKDDMAQDGEDYVGRILCDGASFLQFLQSYPVGVYCGDNETPCLSLSKMLHELTPKIKSILFYWNKREGVPLIQTLEFFVEFVEGAYEDRNEFIELLDDISDDIGLHNGSLRMNDITYWETE